MDKKDIAKLAYELYVCSDCKEGRDLDNWLEAERILASKEKLNVEAESIPEELIQINNTPIPQEHPVVL